MCARLNRSARTISLGALLLVAACTATPVAPEFPLALPSIPEVSSSDGAATVALDVVRNPVTHSPAFAYKGVVGVAPTIRVRPGDAIRVILRNNLPMSDLTDNNVNLHFHGLSVSPMPPGDDVLTTLARPGQTLRYFIRIPPTQPPGLYWYHPHAHGEAFWQVESGMAGAIVVEGLQGRLPLLNTMRERIIILSEAQEFPSLFLVPTSSHRKLVAYAAKHHLRVPVYAGDPDGDADSGPNRICARKDGVVATINGLPQARIAIAPGERQLFRVLNASAGRYFDLAVDGEDLQLVALDGTPLDEYPGSPAVENVHHVLLAPAGRAEFVVTGQPRATALRSKCYFSGVAGDRDPMALLAILKPDASATPLTRLSAPITVSKARATRIIPSRPSEHRTFRLTEDKDGFYINGLAFDMRSSPMVVARAGTTEEWTFLNETDEVHDFHVHQVHVALESVQGTPNQTRHWTDTVTVPPRRRSGRGWTPGNVVVLVDFQDPGIKGDFVFHCHILDHEDGGMMAMIRVL